MKIAIVGSGNGAVTAAVDMYKQGHDVRLYCRNQSIHKFDQALKEGHEIIETADMEVVHRAIDTMFDEGKEIFS